jgi:hypothetical protein
MAPVDDVITQDQRNTIAESIARAVREAQKISVAQQLATTGTITTDMDYAEVARQARLVPGQTVVGGVSDIGKQYGGFLMYLNEGRNVDGNDIVDIDSVIDYLYQNGYALSSTSKEHSGHAGANFQGKSRGLLQPKSTGLYSETYMGVTHRFSLERATA